MMISIQRMSLVSPVITPVLILLFSGCHVGCVRFLHRACPNTAVFACWRVISSTEAVPKVFSFGLNLSAAFSGSGRGRCSIILTLDKLGKLLSGAFCTCSNARSNRRKALLSLSCKVGRSNLFWLTDDRSTFSQDLRFWLLVECKIH